MTKKNVTALRNDLLDIFEQLKAGQIDNATASDLANVAGKVISSAKAQIAYYALLKETPQIDFLEEG